MNLFYPFGKIQVLDIYDSSAGMLRIGPFNYDPIRGVDLWLAQSDEFLLTHLSTSPEVEPPHFTNQVHLVFENKWLYNFFSHRFMINVQ